MARLVDGSDEADAATADTISGLVLALADDTVLCEVRWIDPPPDDAGLQALIASCRAALARVEAREIVDLA